MKKMKNRIMALIGAAGMAAGILGADMTAFADTRGMIVTANVTSTYSVQIPASLELTAESAGSNIFSGTYTGGAKGYILESQCVEISPADSFAMTGDKDGLGADALVTQTVTKWVNSLEGKTDDCMVIGGDSVATTTGTVSVTLKNPDSYTGTLTFAYGLKDLKQERGGRTMRKCWFTWMFTIVCLLLLVNLSIPVRAETAGMAVTAVEKRTSRSRPPVRRGKNQAMADRMRNQTGNQKVNRVMHQMIILMVIQMIHRIIFLMGSRIM